MSDRKQQDTAMVYSRFHEDAIYKIGTECTYSAMKIYLYLNLNCNLATGVMHQVSYSDIAEYWGMALGTVYKGMAELQERGLIIVKKPGSFGGSIPHQGLIHKLSYEQRHTKNEREFYAELDRRLAEAKKGRTAPLRVGDVHEIYDALKKDRASKRKFYPRTHGYMHIEDRLKTYGFSRARDAEKQDCVDVDDTHDNGRTNR